MISTKKISGSDLALSELTLGMWYIHTIDDKALSGLLHTALDQGITTFDHADIYGDYQCEEKFGRWMKANKQHRSSLQLVTKCGIKLLSDKRPDHKVKHYDTSKEHIIASVENSLRQLQTDYLDLLLIHRPDPLMQPAEVASAFEKLTKLGKVRYVGVSNFTPGQFAMLQSYCDMSLVTNQIEVSLVHNELMFDGTLDYLVEKGVQPMAWSPLGGRDKVKELITNEKVKQMAANYEVGEGELLLSWLLQHPSGILPVLGTMNPARLTSAHEALEVKWDKQDWFILLEEVRGFEVP